MRVLIIGLPLFAKRVQRDLSEFDSDNSYTHLDTYTGLWNKVKTLFTVPRVDIVYSLNGAVRDSMVFSLALRFNKILVIHWVGTDVVKAKKHIADNEYNHDIVNKAVHFSEVGWIQKELAESGIESDVMSFVSFEESLEAKDRSVEEFYVLTYITYERAKFYGIDMIISLAKDNPDIVFKIAGMDHYDTELPTNIKLLGWVDNLGEIIVKSGVCLRYTDHDGLSSFVLETLALGKHIIYNNEFDHCMYAQDQQGIEMHINALKTAHANGEEIANTKGEIFIKEKFNKKYVLGALVNKFQALVQNN